MLRSTAIPLLGLLLVSPVSSCAGPVGDTGSDSGPDSGLSDVSPDAGGTDSGTDAGFDAGQGHVGVLVFGDEFNGSALDRTKWCTRLVYPGGPAVPNFDPACAGHGPDGAGTLNFLNDEQERYMDTNSLGVNLLPQAGGIQSLTSTKTGYDPTWAAYESSMLRSKFEFKPNATQNYYVEARVQLPNVVGTWPAMWLLGGYGSNGIAPWPPEIDIFEGALNGVEDISTMVRQGSQVRGGKQTASGSMEITYSDINYDRTWNNFYARSSLRAPGFHVIAAEWTATSICYFVDGLKTACESYKWVDNDGVEANPAHLILNLAIGGNWAGRHGVDAASFPTSFLIDYVHVFQY